MTMAYGYHYTEGKKVGYDISFPSHLHGENTLHNVSYKDKGRIIKELVACGYQEREIFTERVENEITRY